MTITTMDTEGGGARSEGDGIDSVVEERVHADVLRAGADACITRAFVRL